MGRVKRLGRRVAAALTSWLQQAEAGHGWLIRANCGGGGGDAEADGDNDVCDPTSSRARRCNLEAWRFTERIGAKLIKVNSNFPVTIDAKNALNLSFCSH